MYILVVLESIEHKSCQHCLSCGIFGHENDSPILEQFKSRGGSSRTIDVDAHLPLP